MKRKIIGLALLLALLGSAGVIAQSLPTGTWSPNRIFRLPPLGTGIETYFNDALRWVDQRISNEHWLGDAWPTSTSYDTLAHAVTSIGSAKIILHVPYNAGNPWYVGSNLTIPSNITLKFETGIIQVGNNFTLAIQGPVEAGLYQIFSWIGTGAIDLTASPTKRFYLQAWGATPGTVSSGADISPALLKAYQSLTSDTVFGQHEIVLPNGFWWVNTNMTFVPNGGWPAGAYDSNHWIPTLTGEQEYGTVLMMNVGGSADGIQLGGLFSGYTRWMQGAWIKNLTIAGGVSCCRHALNIEAWNNNGGTQNISIQCGATASAVFMTSLENCHWEFNIGFPLRLGVFSALPTVDPYAGIEVDAVTGVGYQNGAGTFNYFKIHKTFGAGCVYALKLANSGNCVIDDDDVETCVGGEVQYHYQALAQYVGSPLIHVPLYAGGTTRIAQTFTLTAPTQINNIGALVGGHGNAFGLINYKIYATSGGKPTGSPIYTSWENSSVSDLSTVLGDMILVKTAQQTLAAGTYAFSVEYSGGDASNYAFVGLDTAGIGPGSCYAYTGGAWVLQTGTLFHVVNAQAAIWLYKNVESVIKSQHLETHWLPLKIDQCDHTTVNSQWIGPNVEITRSTNTQLGGTGSYGKISTDPMSPIALESSRSGRQSRDMMSDYGPTIYGGYLSDVLGRVPTNVKGNNGHNLCPNTLMDRWQTSAPDEWNVPANFAWTKEASLKPPGALFSGKLVYSGSGLNQNMVGPLLQGNSLQSAKGRWINFSFYIMFPAGQSWSSVAAYVASSLTCPAWANATQYNIGDGADNQTVVCVQPGISGGSEPAWSSYSNGDYIVDGTVVWLKYQTTFQNAGNMDTSWSDGVWRRQVITQYIFRNTSASYFYPGFGWHDQANGDPTTAYLALPQYNYGLMPSMAPDPMPATTYGSSVVGANHIDYDAYIPTDGTNSKLKGLWASVGDICWNTGAAHSGTAGWICTGAGINGSSSTWYTFAAVN